MLLNLCLLQLTCTEVGMVTPTLSLWGWKLMLVQFLAVLDVCICSRRVSSQKGQILDWKSNYLISCVAGPVQTQRGKLMYGKTMHSLRSRQDTSAHMTIIVKQVTLGVESGEPVGKVHREVQWKCYILLGPWRRTFDWRFMVKTKPKTPHWRENMSKGTRE